MKRCPGCKRDRPIDDFALDRSRKSGRMGRCRECDSTRNSTYYQANRVDVLARLAAAREADGGEQHRANQRAYAARNPETVRQSRHRSARRHRGMVLEQMWAEQDGLCYLCEEPLPPIGSRSLHIDHDHSCCAAGRSCPSCRRGLTHNGCNTAIGLLGESPAKLLLVAANLERAQASLTAA